MKVELPLKTPITLFVRVKGDICERELQAVLSTASVPVVMLNKDAMQLGYEFIDEISEPGLGTLAVSAGVIIEGPEIILKEVRVGDLVAKDVQALVWNMPTVGGVDMLLGTSFLKNFKATLDYGRGVLTIESLQSL